MSADESDGDTLEGLSWEVWRDTTAARGSSHSVCVPLISADAASMPFQKAVCYGYYPSFEVNSMLLVKCKLCSMLLKDVGYGHHVRSRHAFRAESPASGDECQSFLLSPPHRISSPRHSDSAIVSPPYRKPSTVYQTENAEEHPALVSARTLSPRYSIEQRDDLKLSLRVSRREFIHQEQHSSCKHGALPSATTAGTSELLLCGTGSKDKKLISPRVNKAINGRAKQKKRKKRKIDSSSSDDFSLDHFRRKKPSEGESRNDVSSVPSTSRALQVDLANPVALKKDDGRIRGSRSSALLCIPSRVSAKDIRFPSEFPDGLENAQRRNSYDRSSPSQMPLLMQQLPSTSRESSVALSPSPCSAFEPSFAGLSSPGMRLPTKSVVCRRLPLQGNTAASSPSSRQQNSPAYSKPYHVPPRTSRMSEKNLFYVNAVDFPVDSYRPSMEAVLSESKHHSSLLVPEPYSQLSSSTQAFSSAVGISSAEMYPAQFGLEVCRGTQVVTGASKVFCPSSQETEVETYEPQTVFSDVVTCHSALGEISAGENDMSACVSAVEKYSPPEMFSPANAVKVAATHISLETQSTNPPAEVMTASNSCDAECNQRQIHLQPEGLLEMSDLKDAEDDLEFRSFRLGSVASEERTIRNVDPLQLDDDQRALIAAYSCSSEEELASYKGFDENERSFFVMKRERADSPSSSASVIALSPEVQHSEIEASEIHLEEESEEETDSQQPQNQCMVTAFVDPASRARRPRLVAPLVPPYKRVHRSFGSSLSRDSSKKSVSKRSMFALRRHDDLQYANIRLIFARGMGLPLEYPPPARFSSPDVTSAKLATNSGFLTSKVEACTPPPRESISSRDSPCLERSAAESSLPLLSLTASSWLRGVSNDAGSNRFGGAAKETKASFCTPVGQSVANQSRFSNSAFRNFSSVNSRISNSISGVTVRSHDQNSQQFRSVRSRIVASQKNAVPLILSSNSASLHPATHTVPQQQLRYVYIQTPAISPQATADYSEAYEAANDDLDVEILDGPNYEDYSPATKGGNVHLLRQLSTQRVYDSPPVLKKIRLATQEPLIRNEVLPAVSSVPMTGATRRLARQESLVGSDSSLYLSSSASGAQISSNGTRTNLGAHSYAAAVTAVSRNAGYFGKNAYRTVSTTTGALSRALTSTGHTFRRLSAFGSISSLKSQSVGGSSVLSLQVVSPGMQRVTTSVSNAEQRAASSVSNTVSPRSTPLAGVRTGPRTVTVFPVLGKYSAPSSHLSGVTALYRNSQHMIVSPSSSAACISPIVSESRI